MWSMFALETGFSILITIAAWNEFGAGWGDPDTLGMVDWAWLPMPALNAICKSGRLHTCAADPDCDYSVAAMAQGFYVWRIWSLTSRRLWLPVLIGCVSALTVLEPGQHDLTCR